MKIFKGKYNWSTSAHSKNQDGSENKCYLDVQFKKGTEPSEDIEGDLIFRDELGAERKCFLSSYLKKDGTIVPKLVLLDTQLNTIKPRDTQNVQLNLTGNKDVTGYTDHNVEINPDELPFY